MLKNYFHQTGKMLGHLFKRDGLKLSIWFVSLTTLAGGFAEMMSAMYKNDATGLAGLYETMKNPAMLAIAGTTDAKNASEFTIGAMYAQKMLLFSALVFALISISHVIGRTRREEDDGQIELIRSFQVGRLSNSLAIVLEMFVLHVLIAFGIAGLLQVQDVAGMTHFSANLVFGASLAAQGFLWAIFALFFAQVCESASRARAFSFGFLAVLYVLRMGTDLKNVNLSWFNPLSWSYLSGPFVGNHFLPILLSVLCAVIFVVFAFILESNRDMNAGFLPEQSGRARAHERLLSLSGFIVIRAKGFIVGWLISLFLLGAVIGSIFGDMDKFVQGNQMLKEMYLHNAKFSIQEQFMSVFLMIFAIFSATFALGLLMKLATEEKKHYLDQLYAMKISRRKFYFLYVFVALFCGIFGQFVSSLGLYLAQLSVMKTPISHTIILRSGMVWLPAIFFLIAVLATLIGLLPRMTPVIWIYVVYAFFLSYFGDLLKPPTWVKKTDIFTYISQLPVEKMHWGNVWLVVSLSALLILVGFIGYKKRDLIGE